MGIRIRGVGSYVPERVLTNADLEKMVDTSDEWIVTRTGIRQRHIAAPEQACSDIAAGAAKAALANCGMDATELDLIIDVHALWLSGAFLHPVQDFVHEPLCLFADSRINQLPHLIVPHIVVKL